MLRCVFLRLAFKISACLGRSKIFRHEAMVLTLLLSPGVARININHQKRKFLAATLRNSYIIYILKTTRWTASSMLALAVLADDFLLAMS